MASLSLLPAGVSSEEQDKNMVNENKESKYLYESFIRSTFFINDSDFKEQLKAYTI